jgi:hypothetical protein
MREDLTDKAAEAGIVASMMGSMQGITDAELVERLADIGAPRVAAAVDSLIATGVLRRARTKLYKSEALIRLETIGMVCI